MQEQHAETNEALGEENDEPRFTDEERRDLARAHRRTAADARLVAALAKNPATSEVWARWAKTWEEGARAVERGEDWSPPRAERKLRKGCGGGRRARS